MLEMKLPEGTDLDSQMQLDVPIMLFQGFEIKESVFGFQFKMQAGFKKVLRSERRHSAHRAAHNLTELRRGEQGVLDHIDLPEDDARRLMELGFLPGHTVTPAHSAPGGDPRVFRVDGTEIALRRETARRLILRSAEG